MKKLKFNDDLVQKVLSGEKTSTWRFLDDKNLKEGDKLILIKRSTLLEFAKAIIISVKEKSFEEINDSDFDDGHERFESREKMYSLFKDFYGDQFNEKSILKLIQFKIVD